MTSVRAGTDNPETSRRPVLPGVVGPRAAYVIDRTVGEELDRLVQGLVASPNTGNHVYGRELQAAMASLRESMRQWQQRGDESVAGSATGTAELPQPLDASALEHPPGPGLTTRLVAERLRVSRRQVRNLIDGGKLSATKVRGDWLIDEVSVRDFESRRRI